MAFALGLLVVVALLLSAYFAYKTRSKIWRHGKANIYWDQPVGAPSESRGAPAWVSCIYVNHTHTHTLVNVWLPGPFCC